MTLTSCHITTCHPQLPTETCSTWNTRQHLPRKQAAEWRLELQDMVTNCHTVARPPARDMGRTVRVLPKPREGRSCASAHPVSRMAQNFQNFCFFGVLWGWVHVFPPTKVQNKSKTCNNKNYNEQYTSLYLKQMKNEVLRVKNVLYLLVSNAPNMPFTH